MSQLLNCRRGKINNPMARGLGIRQRLILDALERHGPYYLDALAGGEMETRYRRLYAAAVKLAAADHVQIIKHTTGSPKVVVTTPRVKVAQLDRRKLEANSEQVALWLKSQGER